MISPLFVASSFRPKEVILFALCFSADGFPAVPFTRGKVTKERRPGLQIFRCYGAMKMLPAGFTAT